MKFRKISTALLFTILAGSMVGCNENENTTQTNNNGNSGTNQGSTGNDNENVEVFSFNVSLESNKTSLEVGETDKIVIHTNGIKDQDREYSYKINRENIITIGKFSDGKCAIKATNPGKVIVAITEAKSGISQSLSIEVVEASKPANGGKNFTSRSGAEALKNRAEILGKLEKYAVDSHLTGITLFEDGGYVKYSSRLEIPANQYITGYGFGILSEGNITADLPGEENPAYKRYYHSGQSSNPGKINAMDDTGSQVSDLSSYITSSYWGMKMNEYKNGYEWYPILAKDKVNGKDFTRPIPVPGEDGENALGLYRKWRVYVKTGADGLKYRTNGMFKDEWDNKSVNIKDYEFPIKMLLTGACELARGATLAADMTYGIKGAQSFYNRTKSRDISQEFIDNTWEAMKRDGELGFSYNEEESYLEFELINDIDAFTAMYQLSSSLYSPIPQEFVTMLGGGEFKNGAKVYGEAKQGFEYGGSKVTVNPKDTTLSVGAYYLEEWNDKDDFITFKQNDTWFERVTYPERHKIEGIKIKTYKGAQEDLDALYKAFYNDELDSCGVPTLHISEEKYGSKITKAKKETVTKQTKGESTFKLNVNSCTQDRWDELFGPNGSICVTPDSGKYQCKPWMSNENFLNGLYWSINRQEFADKRGVQPSINYFSNAYLDDPENGHSYNETEAHKEAVKNYHNVDKDGNDDYGYNLDTAIACFTRAYNELRATGAINDGTPSNPEIIKIQINWMNPNDITEYGTDIKKYFEDAFNNPAVCGNKVKLVVEQPSPSSDWQAVYNDVMMKGQFDLAFGSISGNTFDPLNFMEVLKSDNSSGFTLNWGVDTSVVDEKRPLVYQNERYSYDALWQVADHGGIVKDGKIVSSIKTCYLGTPKDSSGKATNDLFNGFTASIPMEFIDVQDVELKVSKISLFVLNGNTYNIPYVYDEANNCINITISPELASQIENDIKVASKNDDPNKSTYIEHPFTRSYYNELWNFELTYTLAIMGGSPVATTVGIAMTQDEQKYK